VRKIIIFERLFRHIRIVAATLLLATAPMTSHAKNVDIHDPERKPLLDAARNNEDIRFVVKYMIRDEDLAYLCALKMEKNGIVSTDGQMDINSYLFVKSGEKWIVWDEWGVPAEKYDAKYCEPSDDYYNGLPDDLEGDSLALVSMTAKHTLEFLLEYRNETNWKPEQRDAISALRKHDWIERLPIDLGEKEVRGLSSAWATSEGPCHKEVKCLSNVKDYYERLVKLRNAKDISNLVWGACENRGIYGATLEGVDRCIATFRAKPYCRPGMEFFRGRADVMRCLAEIDKMPK
jgi:hypothetical protein